MKLKKTIMPQMLSVLIVITLLAMTSGASYASTIEPEKENMDFNVSEKVSDLPTEDIEIENLAALVNMTETLGFEVSNLTVDDNNYVLIDLERKGIESTIKVSSATDQELSLTTTEGNVCNEVQVNDDGTMYIDGKLVQNRNDVQALNTGIVNMNAFQDTYQVRCPYGAASNYSVHYRTISDKDVSWTTTRIKLTSYAFSLMLSALFPTFGPTLELATIIADYFKQYAPYSTCGSYVSKEYFHTKGYFVSSTLAVRKCVMTVYSKPNMGGVKKAVTAYFCHTYTY